MRQLYCAGISLIELMLSLLLGSILLLSAINLLSHELKDYQQQQQYLRQLEHWRTLDFIFSRAIHMAGFFGCISPLHAQFHNRLLNLRSANPYFVNSVMLPPPLFAYHVSQSDTVPEFIRQYAKLNSDALIVNYLGANTTVLQQDMSSTASILKLRDKLFLRDLDTLIINDCQHIDMFTTSNKNLKLRRYWLSSLNPSNKLSRAYLHGAQLGKFTWQLFYLRKTKDHPLTYGLFRQNESGRSDELLDKVKNMRIYVALQHRLADYIPVTKVQNWQQVRKVKIDIELQNGKQQFFLIALRN